MIELDRSLEELFGPRLKRDELLSKHTNFRIGGPAKWFVEARTEEEMIEAIRLAKDAGVPAHVMGGGSNTLAFDEGFPGLVLQAGMRTVSIGGTTVVAGAGALSVAVARQTVEAGLRGMEWAISLPGTIGGAVRGNAGCYGGEMRDVVSSVRILREDGRIETTEAPALRFSYRESALKHSRDIVLSVTMELKEGDRDALRCVLEETLAKRKGSQPLYAGSAGCVFKNNDLGEDELQRLEASVDLLPPEMRSSRRVSAGWLIDKLGLKGQRIGNAQISPEHGNFIINLGNATASDVTGLISLVKMRARDELGVRLEEEVQYLGREGQSD